jgi:hypothetical protein
MFARNTVLFENGMRISYEGVNGVIMSFFINFCFFFHSFQCQFTSYLVVLSLSQGQKLVEPTLGIQVGAGKKLMSQMVAC